MWWIGWIGLGCAVGRSFPTLRENFEKEGLPRAAFEMQCEREKLRLIELNTPLDGEVMRGGQVGVEGCGRRAVYVRMNGAWVANTVRFIPLDPLFGQVAVRGWGSSRPAADALGRALGAVRRRARRSRPWRA